MRLREIFSLHDVLHPSFVLSVHNKHFHFTSLQEGGINFNPLSSVSVSRSRMEVLKHDFPLSFHFQKLRGGWEEGQFEWKEGLPVEIYRGLVYGMSKVRDHKRNFVSSWVRILISASKCALSCNLDFTCEVIIL